MAEASDFSSVNEFKEHLINNLAHVIAGIHCESLWNTRALLGELYDEVNEYLSRTTHVRRELFTTPPDLPRGGLFAGQQAEEPTQQTHQWLSGLNPCDEVYAWPSEVLSVKIEDTTSIDQRYAPVCSPISVASAKSNSEDSHQVLPEDLSQQIATDTPINMMECNDPYIAMLKNYADEWGFSLQKEFATDNIL